MAEETYTTYEVHQKKYSTADGWSDWEIIRSYTENDLLYFGDPTIKLMSEYSTLALRDSRVKNSPMTGNTITRLVKVQHTILKDLTPKLSL